MFRLFKNDGTIHDTIYYTTHISFLTGGEDYYIVNYKKFYEFFWEQTIATSLEVEKYEGFRVYHV